MISFKLQFSNIDETNQKGNSLFDSCLHEKSQSQPKGQYSDSCYLGYSQWLQASVPHKAGIMKQKVNGL